MKSNTVFIHHITKATFCYLGDMFSAGGGCDHAIAARCCAAWGKFLTSKHISFKTRGKVFTACVWSTMLHGSETWAPNASDLQRLRRSHDQVDLRCKAGR